MFRRWVGSASVLCAVVACGTDAVPNRVEPAALRRLSNTEYLHALHDLFPTVDVPLPPLPSDNAVSGFENDIEAQAPSDVRIARFETIANLYAAEVTKDDAAVAALTGCTAWSTPTAASSCAAQFIRTIGLRVYRRPLTDDEVSRLSQRFTEWATAIDFPAAVQLTLSTMLQSPHFVYRAEPIDDGDPGIAPVEPYAMASRLAFFLWESTPDDELLSAAGANQLSTEEHVRRQAARMLADPKARRLVWDFHRQWLVLDRILNEEHEVRTPDIDPAWTVASQMSTLEESRRFVERSFGESGTLSDLLTSRRTVIDGEMARIYGVPAPSDGSWTSTTLPADQRAGILTRGAFLAGYSHRGGTSPPIRGNAIKVRLLCQLATSPPDDADLSMPVAAPGDGPKTNRMLFEERTAGTACEGCHRSLNGFGFGFENYTAGGAYITEQQGLPIDATGVILDTDVDGPFANALEMSSAFARSEVVYRCAVQRWVQYALGRSATKYEEAWVDELVDRFVAGGGDLRTLLADIVTSRTFRSRRIPSS